MEKAISRLEEWIVIIVFSTMSIIAFLNVIFREVGSFSLSFTEEITINLFVLLTFVGTAIGVREHAHLGFTLVYDYANGLFKKLIILFVGLITALLFLVLVYFGIKMVLFQIDTGQKTPSLGWSQWIFTLAMPVGALLCLNRTLQATFKEYKAYGAGKEEAL